MQLVLDTNGLTVKKRNNAFWIVAKGGRRLISPKRVDSIAVTADCLFSTAAIRLAAQHGIPIYFFDRVGRPEAKLWAPNFGSLARIRREQYRWAETTAATQWVIELFRLKTEEQLSNLRHLRRRKRKTRLEKVLDQEMIAHAKDMKSMQVFGDQPIFQVRNNLMGVEGAMGRRYWNLVSQSLPKAYQFPGRSRRPAQNLFNAALNYSYGMLYHTVGQAALAAGLDTHLGLLHADQYNKPTFVFDLIEPFRPWIDYLVIEACMDHKIPIQATDPVKNGIWLSQKGRQFVIEHYHEHMQSRVRWRGRVLSRTNHIYRFAGELGQTLLNQTPAPPSDADPDPLDLL